MTVQRGTTAEMRVEVTDGGNVDENDDWKVRREREYRIRGFRRFSKHSIRGLQGDVVYLC
jgi:hypothetical protein